MNICVIGGTGHIGTFLVPLLVQNGHQVTVLTSGRTPVPTGSEWQKVNVKQGRYSPDKTWLDLVAGAGAEVLIDILGVDVPGVYGVVKKTCRHMIVCGSTWMWGSPRIVPTPPAVQGPCEFEGYARRIKEMLATKDAAKRDGIAFTGVMPPNICGPGKIPLDTAGGRDIKVHQAIKNGTPVVLPEGCNTLIGPCDASDIAAIFALAVEHRDAAADEIFNAGSDLALTASEFVETYAQIYKTKIPTPRVSWKRFLRETMPDPGANYHYREHMCPDISKTRIKLGYSPKFTPQATMERAVEWMYREKLL
ncbi:MAG: NAD(P)-dependent oxidoreductase [Phycisphaerae bacterium]